MLIQCYSWRGVVVIISSHGLIVRKEDNLLRLDLFFTIAAVLSQPSDGSGCFPRNRVHLPCTALRNDWFLAGFSGAPTFHEAEFGLANPCCSFDPRVTVGNEETASSKTDSFILAFLSSRCLFFVVLMQTACVIGAPTG